MNKRMLSVFMVVLIILASSYVDISATTIPEVGQTIITKDNNEGKIAVTNDGEYLHTAELNNIEDTLTLYKQKTVTHEIVFQEKYNLRDTDLEFHPDPIDYGPLASKTKQNTFSNYEYTIWWGSPNDWHLRRPKDGVNNFYYMDCTETSFNRAYLESFRQCVESINNLEWQWIAAMGVGSITMLLSAIFTGGLSSYLAVVGAAGAAELVAFNLQEKCNDAEFYYFRVMYAKP